MRTLSIIMVLAIAPWLYSQEPTPRKVLKGHRSRASHGFVRCVAFALDGKTLASFCDDGVVKLWDAASGEEWNRLDAALASVPASLQAVRLAFSPDGRFLAVAETRVPGDGKGSQVTLCEVATWKQARVFRGHVSYVWSLSFDRMGELLATASADGTARLWKVSSGEQVGLFKPGGEFVHAAALAPDGKLLATASRVGVKLWDTGSGKERCFLKGRGVFCLAFSPDGKTLATGHAVRFRFTRGSDTERDLPGGEVRLYRVAGLLNKQDRK